MRGQRVITPLTGMGRGGAGDVVKGLFFIFVPD